MIKSFEEAAKIPPGSSWSGDWEFGEGFSRYLDFLASWRWLMFEEQWKRLRADYGR